MADVESTDETMNIVEYVLVSDVAKLSIFISVVFSALVILLVACFCCSHPSQVECDMEENLFFGPPRRSTHNCGHPHHTDTRPRFTTNVDFELHLYSHERTHRQSVNKEHGEKFQIKVHHSVSLSRTSTTLLQNEEPPSYEFLMHTHPPSYRSIERDPGNPKEKHNRQPQHKCLCKSGEDVGTPI